jgi:hypothetical protein
MKFLFLVIILPEGKKLIFPKETIILKSTLEKNETPGFQHKGAGINNRMWIVVNAVSLLFIVLHEQADIHFLKSRRDAALQSFSTIC